MGSPDPCANEFRFITGQEWQKLGSEIQADYIEKAFCYWRRRGFPYPCLTLDEVRHRFRRLSAFCSRSIFLQHNELQSSTIGLEVANSFHPQMWSIDFARHRSPVQCFHDDDILKACLRQALSLWPKRKGASASVLRDMLRTYRHSRRVSNFRPAVAKALYERYSSPGSRVLDFSAGYGGRLLGCLTLPRHYVGYDPCQLQIKGLRSMYKAIRQLGLTESTAELRQACAEDAMKSERPNSFDLIFTSPPYFDREKYSTEPTQSFIRYPTYSTWREGFLSAVIAESHLLLKPNGYLILNVADLENAPIASDTKGLAAGLFTLLTTYRLRMSTLPFFRRRASSSFRYEPVLVYRKTG